MSATTTSTASRWGWRLVPLAAVLLVGWYVFFRVLRPEAYVAVVTRGLAVHAVPGSVEVKAEYIMELKSEVSGRIISTTLDPGEKVVKGDVLVQIDTGDVDLEIERIQADIKAARRKVELGSTMKADVLNMRDTVANFERLTKIGNYPEAELEKRRRELQQIEQRMELDEVNNQLALDTNENALRTKQREKEKMTIVAPTDGVISEVEVNARVGDLIGRDQPIATLISSTRSVEAKISEENFSGLAVGQKASVRFLGYGSQLYGAAISKVLPTANAETQRYVVHLDVDLPVEKLVPGLTGEVSIVIGKRDAEAIIPRRAVRGNEVFVVTDGRVDLRKIQLGYVALNQVEVLQGLRAGEQVIVEDLDRFQPGDHVRAKVIK
jgi:RND family efflux transporter MFP subunit